MTSTSLRCSQSMKRSWLFFQRYQDSVRSTDSTHLSTPSWKPLPSWLVNRPTCCCSFVLDSYHKSLVMDSPLLRQYRHMIVRPTTHLFPASCRHSSIRRTIGKRWESMSPTSFGFVRILPRLHHGSSTVAKCRRLSWRPRHSRTRKSFLCSDARRR